VTSRTQGTVRIVGAGLIGTSVGLALSKLGVDVCIEDISPAVRALAIDYGAGRVPKSDDAPTLILVCVPPDVTAAVVARELEAYPNAVVTDVASVKSAILKELSEKGADLSRYVGSHPMAGRERGGAASGRADLFFGRVWVISPTQQSTSKAVQAVENLALDLAASPISVSAADHDRAVAYVSHLPQLISSLTAAALLDAADSDIALAGQGVRDTTRIAASDPKLWLQILAANATEVRAVLGRLQADLNSVAAALDQPEASGSLSTLNSLLERGNAGVAKLPGKHGTKATIYSVTTVMIDDKPGELARLLTEIGEIGVNLEEIKLEHSPSSPVGLVEVSVLPAVEATLVAALAERGWKLVG
jgi:prephenate dehydrogenase